MKRSNEEISGGKSGEGSGAQKRLEMPSGPLVNVAASSTEAAEAILAFAAKNHRRRFFFPTKENSFGGIPYQHVMVDSGCSSALFPFPSPDAGVDLAQLFPPSLYNWGISQSHGTGASHCPVLKIQGKLQARFNIVLNGKTQPVGLSFMRFHLGSSSAATVRDRFPNHFQPADMDILNNFLKEHPKCVSERRHVLLGQSYCDSVFSAQVQDIIIFMDATHWISYASSLPQLFIYCHEAAKPLIEAYGEFHDLEDDDHDGDDKDEEDVRLSWDTEPEDIDEIMT